MSAITADFAADPRLTSAGAAARLAVVTVALHGIALASWALLLPV